MKTNNHPAHGPVSLDRLHKIREILSKAAAQSDGGNLGYAMADAVKVIDGVLESIAREQVRREHAAWSQATFGDVGPVGPLKHLSKEALEAAAEPGDLSEFADMQFLLWHAQRRAGISDEQITQAMVEKLAVNKQREWPVPRDGEPRLHIKDMPAPVMPEECPAELPYAQVKAAADLYALCWQSGEVVTYTPDPEKATIWLNNYSGTCVQEYVKLERLQEALAGNASIIPDGYALVPVEPTRQMMAQGHFAMKGTDRGKFRRIYQAMITAAPALNKGGINAE